MKQIKNIQMATAMGYPLSRDETNILDSALELFQQMRFNPGQVSDGYHTFDELYRHRAVLFSVICHEYSHLAWKSLKHSDPEYPMFEGMFIVGINTPEGQATYHYDIDPYWDLFDVPEYDCAPEYDGHTSEDAIKRILSLVRR